MGGEAAVRSRIGLGQVVPSTKPRSQGEQILQARVFQDRGRKTRPAWVQGTRHEAWGRRLPAWGLRPSANSFWLAAEDFAQPFYDLFQFLGRSSRDPLPQSFDREPADLVDLDPGAFREIGAGEPRSRGTRHGIPDW